MGLLRSLTLVSVLVLASSAVVAQPSGPFNIVSTKPGEDGDNCDRRRWPGAILVIQDMSVMRCDRTSGQWEEETFGGTSGTPGGSDTHVQYKDGTAFGGDSGFTYNDATDSAVLAGVLTLGGLDCSAADSFLTTNGSGLLACATLPADTSTPGGLDTELQWNDDGTLDGVTGVGVTDGTSAGALGEIEVLDTSINIATVSSTEAYLKFWHYDSSWHNRATMYGDSEGFKASFGATTQFVGTSGGIELQSSDPVIVTDPFGSSSFTPLEVQLKNGNSSAGFSVDWHNGASYERIFDVRIPTTTASNTVLLGPVSTTAYKRPFTLESVTKQQATFDTYDTPAFDFTHTETTDAAQAHTHWTNGVLGATIIACLDDEGKLFQGSCRNGVAYTLTEEAASAPACGFGDGWIDSDDDDRSYLGFPDDVGTCNWNEFFDPSSGSYLMNEVADHEWSPQTADLHIGDADEGIIRMGGAYCGTADDTVGGLALNDTLVCYNPNDVASDVAFMHVSSSNLPRFVIQEEGTGKATYNPRSFVVGPGASALSDAATTYCGAGNAFPRLDCDTGATGADLGVQDDIQIGGQLVIGTGAAGDKIIVFDDDDSQDNDVRWDDSLGRFATSGNVAIGLSTAGDKKLSFDDDDSEDHDITWDDSEARFTTNDHWEFQDTIFHENVSIGGAWDDVIIGTVAGHDYEIWSADQWQFFNESKLRINFRDRVVFDVESSGDCTGSGTPYSDCTGTDTWSRVTAISHGTVYVGEPGDAVDIVASGDVNAQGDGIYTGNVSGVDIQVGDRLDFGGYSDDDCTGQQGEFWWDNVDSQFEACPANSGTPDVIEAAPTSEYWSGYGPASATVITSGYAVVLATEFESSGSNFTFSSGIVTVEASGTYRITMDAAAYASSGNGSDYADFYLQKRPDGGSFATVTGTICSVGLPYFPIMVQSCSMTFVLDVTAGDSFQIYGIRMSSTRALATPGNRNRLTFTEVH